MQAKRLIDANALKDLRDKYIRGELEFDGDEYNLIDKCPTIDAVEVVRCQNCKHSAEWERGLWCTWHDDMYATEDYFCADGERKDNE